MNRDTVTYKSFSSATRRQQLQQHQRSSDETSSQLSVLTPLIGVFCVTGVLLVATFHRSSRTQCGPCTVDPGRRTVYCSRSTSLTALPVDIPDTTQTLAFNNDTDSDGRLINNQFGTLQRSNLTRLRRLRDLGLVSCGITHLERMTFVDLLDLRRLDLRHNALRYITNGSFIGISKLDVLMLSGNPLVELGANAFSGLTVSRLELIANTLLSRINETAFEQSRVSAITLDRCCLDVVDGASWKYLMTSLRELTITNNVRPLIVEQNALSAFRLKILTLVNDSITDARFLTSGDHDVIILDDNPALWNTSVVTSLKGARKKTRKMSLSGTAIVQLSDVFNMSVFSDLEVFNVSDNHIRVLNASEFSDLDRLRVLDLSDNEIDQFAGDFNETLTQLEVLVLDRNRLQTVPEAVVRPLFERVKSGVSLTNNPLHYNCELRWLLMTLVQLDDVTDNDINNDVSDELFECRSPVILNSTANQSELVCIAFGDPAPRVTWSAGDVLLLAVEQPKTVRNVSYTQAELTVSRLGNYTCTAVNVVGRVNATVTVTEIVDLTKVFAIKGMKRETISIITSPAGFALTALLLVLLGYLFKHQ